HLSSDYITKILVDSLGFIWIATSNGLDKLNPKTGLFEHYLTSEENHISNIGYYIGDMIEDGSKYLLIAGRGLFRLEKKRGNWYRLGKYRPQKNIL
ncbi:hypothetical protein JW935_03410, partial [candidate division KSB1 bacterium]|nr:hypothetical protein [candidate division KSB1 bacterium]